VPVVSRTEEVLGGLFFGHADVGVFSGRHERLLIGIAAQASFGIDNARLFEAARRELRERRHAEEQRELLINELNHRVKNTLSIVQSAIAQTLRNSPVEAAIRVTLEARLIALSDVHNLLTQENWTGTTLDDVVQIALQPYRDAVDDRFELRGPPLRLTPKMALTIALALHELTTNAIKYGALANEAGHVKIVWCSDKAEDGRRLKLTWAEHGGPIVETPKQRGFGSRLIEHGLASDLGGEATLSFAPTGVVCTIEASLPAG
jgi:two-component sensor histidine kinase